MKELLQDLEPEELEPRARASGSDRSTRNLEQRGL